MFDEAPKGGHALMQDPAFAQALTLCGQKPVILSTGHMLLKRRLWGVPVAMLPRALPPDDLATVLHASGIGRIPVILSPDTPTTIQNAVPLRRPQYRAILKLYHDDDFARTQLHPKWRNQLRLAERSSLRISFDRLYAKTTQSILRIEKTQTKNRKYSNWPIGLTAAFAACAPDQTHLFTATYAGQTVAHMLFLTHGRQASYHIGHITPEGKRNCAHNLLLWRAARFFAVQGFVSLDLGLLDDTTSGLNRFKLRSGAQRQETGGTWLYWQPFARRRKQLSVA